MTQHDMLRMFVGSSQREVSIASQREVSNQRSHLIVMILDLDSEELLTQNCDITISGVQQLMRLGVFSVVLNTR